MKEQIRAPEKIQLSDEEIANIPDAEFKTLVIRMLTEMVEYVCKMEKKVKKVKAMQSVEKCTRNQQRREENWDSNQWFGAEGRNKHSSRIE